ncbi:U exon [unidentified adenovirus]|uniref:U exon n=1 Tax=Chinstrap penguin adenovirus 2 TaxID=1434088 RepID=A0A162HSL6_9ADEN|nr:U exon [Chinstrap penguin adenovirus 2]ALB78154.1 U exon [Chinstrap penguin adenovirus 2]ALB78176.1 U exon [unidentified adenovirus]ALB78198.1 U exon [unidentified adenovirus]ALB78220.1 U exon [unidentified adenovirus]
MGNSCTKLCPCCRPKRIDERWISNDGPSQKTDEIDGPGHPHMQARRVTATQLLCQTCLYWLIRYCIQNSDLILETLFPSIHDQVEG